MAYNTQNYWVFGESRDRTVGIATAYGLDDRGVGVRDSVVSRIFSSPPGPDRLGSGDHPASYLTGTGAIYPGVKRPGRDADHSPPTNAEVKKT
jgi:hypothetical protein